MVQLILKALKLSSLFTLLQIALYYFPFFFLLKRRRAIISQLAFFKLPDFLLSGIFLFVVIFSFELSGILDESNLYIKQYPTLYLLLQWIAMVLANSFFVLVFPYILKKQTNRLSPSLPLQKAIYEKLQVHIPVYITNENCINAFAIGLFKKNRFIVVGNVLVAACTEEEVIAILCHEYGHHKHRDLVKFFLFMSLGLLCFLIFRDSFLTFCHFVMPGISEPTAIGLYGGLNGLIFGGILFSRLSHHAEYEADYYSATHNTQAPMIMVLQKISELSEHLFDKGGITHPSLEKRINNIKNRIPAIKKYTP